MLFIIHADAVTSCCKYARNYRIYPGQNISSIFPTKASTLFISQTLEFIEFFNKRGINYYVFRYLFMGESFYLYQYLANTRNHRISQRAQIILPRCYFVRIFRIFFNKLLPESYFRLNAWNILNIFLFSSYVTTRFSSFSEITRAIRRRATSNAIMSPRASSSTRSADTGIVYTWTASKLHPSPRIA